MNRRQFSKLLLAGTGMILPGIARASLRTMWTDDRAIWIYRPDTRETYREIYWSNGQIIPDAYIRLCSILRDTTDGVTAQMDPELFKLLYGLQRWAVALSGQDRPFEVLSGLRTREHNAHVEGSAQNSQHIAARAVDGRIAGVTPGALADMARYIGFGGVGIYDTFTHVDVGSTRSWTRVTRPIR